MAFTGRYKTVKLDNAENFFKAVGHCGNTDIDEQPQIEVLQDGDTFTVTNYYETRSLTMKFTLNEEAELETYYGEKIKATVTMLGGRVFIPLDSHVYMLELCGDKLIEHRITDGEDGVSMRKINKRM